MTTIPSTKIRVRPSKYNTARDAKVPYKIAMLLLYGRVEGIEMTSPGVRVVDYKKMRKVLGNLSFLRIAMLLQSCVDLGVFSYMQNHKSYAVIKLNLPLDMQLIPTVHPTTKLSWEQDE